MFKKEIIRKGDYYQKWFCEKCNYSQPAYTTINCCPKCGNKKLSFAIGRDTIKETYGLFGFYIGSEVIDTEFTSPMFGDGIPLKEG